MIKNIFDEVIKYDPVNHYILFTLDELKQIKSKITSDKLKELESNLSSYMFSYKENKQSVIFKKHSIDGIKPNDYVSLATYYWPDETKKDGLPYVSIDGKSNPEGEEYDKPKLRKLAFMTYYQAILYFLTDKKEYHDLIVENLTYFFLDKEYGMNPNMNHGQLIKGLNLGRGIGIIDYSANFTYALGMLKILKDLGKLDISFVEKLDSWLKEFLKWLTYSDIALAEKYSNNNHGTFYDLVLIAINDFLDNKDEIKPLVYQMIEQRIISQIDEFGKMPLEVARTKSISYSLMGYKGITDFAHIAKKYGYDLWNINSWYYKKIKQSLTKGLEFLTYYLVENKEKWPYEQITIFDRATILPIIYLNHKKGKLTVINLDNIDILDTNLYILLNSLL